MSRRDTLARVDEDPGRVPGVRRRLRGLDSAREQLAALPAASPEDPESSGHADVKGFPAAAGCLVLAGEFLAVWVIGVVILFR